MGLCFLIPLLQNSITDPCPISVLLRLFLTLSGASTSMGAFQKMYKPLDKVISNRPNSRTVFTSSDAADSETNDAKSYLGPFQ